MTVIQFPGNPRPSYFRGEATILILPVVRIERRIDRDRKMLREFLALATPRKRKIPITESSAMNHPEENPDAV